jgi:SAM-dependent methyltransferase
MKMNINIGGTKGWHKIHASIRKNWKILDVMGTPDFDHDLNSGEPLPFKDNSVDNYYCSHTLEHVKPELVVPLVHEMHRTLKHEGMIRVVVPNIITPMRHYLDGDEQWLRHQQEKERVRLGYPDTALGCLMLWFYSTPKSGRRSGHKMVFDWPTLACCFRIFRQVTSKSYGECNVRFAGLDFTRHAGKSLYLEAVK